MPNIRPFRDYDEHEVVNLFKFSGTIPATKGTIVKILSGWYTNANPTQMLGSVGASYANTVSQRYGVPASVGSVATGDTAFGLLLYDVREVDENGEQLIFRPTKLAEMQAVLSGQAVPVLTRGLVLYSGIDGAPTPGASVYASGGQVTMTALGNAVGRALGPKDNQGYALIKFTF